ncbi:MAG: ABC transporter permease subunit [SAR202 cluster bacterium]|nr:ABC transporter permease subunit [SAR202 cluster bacterium]|tara:strand:+ start:1629 stop:2669 length:1041 start_codon:yes stop_codon:yes gene_type:complete
MAADLSGIVIAPPTRRAKAAGIYRKFKRWPVIPVFLLGLVVFSGLFAPLISPHDPEKGELRERNIPPAWSDGEKATKTVVERMSINERTTSVTLSDAQKIDPAAQLGDQLEVFVRPAGSTKFLLGTDHLGRDVLSRVIYGARISLLVSIVTLAVGGSIGVVMGLAAGWYGGVVDEILMRLVDIKLAIPLILIALVLVITLGQSLWIIVTVLCLFIWPRFARQVRGEVLQLKHMDYVSLAKVSGASTARILFIHIFPGTINTLIVVATLQVGIVILLESTLSFLGAGVPPPTPAWGSMVADGRDKLAGGVWWISTFPGIAIMLTVMSLNLFGDWLRDTLDPRLRQLE